MTVSISVTLDDDLGDELNAAVAGGNRSALVADLAGGGTIDLSRIRFADPSAFQHRHGRIPATLAARVDHGLRRFLGL